MDDSREAALEQIAEEVRNLTGSPLYAYRQEKKYHAVIGEGDINSQIVFIGEAPGEKEAKTGRPFVGASGRLLDELLAKIGYQRKDVYITNIVKDRPPENRDPTPQEIRLYAPFLVRQLEILQPQVIATLGRFAMDFILDLFEVPEKGQKISNLHGKVLTGRAPYGEVKVVPLFHPAVALYAQDRKQTLVDDFQVLKQLAAE